MNRTMLRRLREMPTDPICPQREYLALRTEERQLFLRINKGEPPDGALAPASEWLFRLPLSA